VDTSKKQSGANWSSPREPLVFFTDAMLGRRVIPGALRAAGERVEAHDENFKPGTPDSEWLLEVGKRGWVVLTKDKRIRYRPIETAALWRARVRAFVLVARGDLSGAEIGSIFVKALPAMRRFCAEVQPPFIAHVFKDSGVKLVRPGTVHGRRQD